MFNQILEEIGLTPGEAKVYLALLKIGLSTTGPIVKESGVSRSKVYEMLDGLIDMGLVSYVIQENVKQFQAHDPNRVLDYLHAKRKVLKNQEKNFEAMLPKLRAYAKKEHEPQTSTIYEGFKGIKSIFSHVLSTVGDGGSYFAIGVDPVVYEDEMLLNFLQQHHRRRESKKIQLKILFPKEIVEDATRTIGNSKYMDIRCLKHVVPDSMLIFKNHVATYVWGERPVGVLIQSSVIYERYEQFFLDQWKKAQ